jgi:ABC-type amino acid transport substrate-binding protein
MKKLLFLLVFGIQAFAVKEEALVVGTTSGYAPYVSINPKGEYEGFDIDVAERVAKRLGRRLVLKDCGNMPSLMMALKQGKVDILIWAVSITEERMKKMEMVYYQGEKVTTLPIFFWKEIPDGIRSLEDLAQKGVCVEGGSFQESVLKSVPGVSLKYLDKIDDAIMDVKYGKSVAGSVDYSLLPRVKAQYPEIRVLDLPIPEDKQSMGFGICVSKDRQELASQLKQAVKELTEEGQIAELEKKWKLAE